MDMKNKGVSDAVRAKRTNAFRHCMLSCNLHLVLPDDSTQAMNILELWEECNTRGGPEDAKRDRENNIWGAAVAEEIKAGVKTTCEDRCKELAPILFI